MPSGSHYCHKGACGIFFWGAHGHDAIWHLSLAAKAFSTLPFNLPIFAGETLRGYNYFFDFLIFLVSRFGIPPIITYFKIFPVFWFIAILGLSVNVARKLIDSALFVGIFIFFIFFGGSFGYLLSLWHTKSLAGSASLLAMQSGHTLINPPYAFSLICILAIMHLLLSKKKSDRLYVIVAMLSSLTLAFKFYGGVLVGIFVFTYYTLNLFISKKSREYIIATGLLVISIVVCFFLFYDPFGSSKSGAIFTLDPLATVHPFIEEKNLFYLPQTVLARYYLAEHGFGPRLLYIESLTFSLFVLFNFGTRIFGLLYIAYLFIKKKLTAFDLSLLITIIVGIFLSSFFVQKGQWWNTIQFLYYSLFLTNIFAARFLYHLIQRKKIYMHIIAGLIILATIPINIDLLHDFTGWPAPAYLPQDELQALNKLKTMPKGIVLTNSESKNTNTDPDSPRALYSYDDTAYVSAFSGKQTYAANKTQLEILGVSYKNRYAKIKKGDCSILPKIDYIYELSTDSLDSRFDHCGVNIKQIYTNNLISIFRVGVE